MVVLQNADNVDTAITSQIDVQLNSIMRLISRYPLFYTSPMASSALQH